MTLFFLYFILLMTPAAGTMATIVLAEHSKKEVRLLSLFLVPIATFAFGSLLFTFITVGLEADMSPLIPVALELYLIKIALFAYYPILLAYIGVNEVQGNLLKRRVLGPAKKQKRFGVVAVGN